MPIKGFETTIAFEQTTSSIIVVHSTPLIRLGIASALRLYAGLHGKAVHTGAQVSDVAAAIRASDRGDVIIGDYRTWAALEKDTSGLRDHIRARGVAVCLVACADEGSHRLLQLRGVAGVVSPDCEPRELEDAIGAIVEGRTHFKTDRLAPTTGIGKLSCRQVEILELMTRGLLNKQIAWELGVTEGTVKSHVSAILEKLGCDRRTQAIAAFLQSLGVGHSASGSTLHA